MFTITLYDKNFTYPLNTGTLSFDVLKFSSYNGSSDKAEIRVSCEDETELFNAASFIRNPIVINDDLGNIIWTGYINETLLEINGLRVGKSLEGMANRIQIIYTDDNDETNESDFQQDDASVSKYGTKEKQITVTKSNEENAVYKRDNVLQQIANPIDDTSLTNSYDVNKKPSLVLKCNGWIYTLMWKLYRNEIGSVSFLKDASNYQSVGKTSSSVNDITVDSGGRYIAGTSGFFKRFIAGETIVVTGFTNSENNGEFIVSKVSDGGNFLYIDHETVVESAGSSVNFAPKGTASSQSFSLPTGHDWILNKVSVPLFVNSDAIPDGGLQAQITTVDGSGLPVSALAFSIVKPVADIPVDKPDFVDFYFTGINQITLDDSQDYAIVIGKSGSVQSSAGYYQMVIEGIEADYSGVAGRIISGGWILRPDSDYPFIISGYWTIKRKMESILSNAEFVRLFQFETEFTKYVNPAVSGQYSLWIELNELLNIGSDTNYGAIAQMNNDRMLFLRDEPLQQDFSYYLNKDGSLSNRSGVKMPDYIIPSGVWVKLRDFFSINTNVPNFVNTEYYFIERCEYSVGSNKRNFVHKKTKVY